MTVISYHGYCILVTGKNWIQVRRLSHSYNIRSLSLSLSMSLSFYKQYNYDRAYWFYGPIRTFPVFAYYQPTTLSPRSSLIRRQKWLDGVLRKDDPQLLSTSIIFWYGSSSYLTKYITLSLIYRSFKFLWIFLFTVKHAVVNVIGPYFSATNYQRYTAYQSFLKHRSYESCFVTYAHAHNVCWNFFSYGLYNREIVFLRFYWSVKLNPMFRIIIFVYQLQFISLKTISGR